MLASTLLDNEMKIISTTVVEAVASCDAVGLMCDGWSNIRNQPIINFVLTTPEPVFWKTIASGTISHTGEYISEEIIKVIEEINAKTDTKVLGIVTDNAANMKKAWQLVKEKYPTVICYGCAAHSLDLIFSDLNKLSSLKSLMSKVISIVKEFKQSHILGEFLRKYQGQKAISLKLPVKTRWGSTVICLKSLHINKHALMKLIVDKDQEENKGIKISNQTEVNILSQPFWDAVNGCILLLSPLADAIAKVESNKPMLSNILPIFDSLKETFDTYIRQSPLSGADEIQALKILEDRREFCIKTIHKAANLLDPRFFGSSLSPEEQVDVMEFISEIAERMPAVDQEKVLTDLSHYLAKEQFFSKKFLWIAADSASPTAWWTGFCRSTELSKVASAFLKLPATTAAVERSFSTYANIHTARRNRLSTKRAGKLVYVSQNLKLQNPASNVKIPTKNIETSKVQATSSHDSHESLSISETIAVDSELEVTTASSSEIDSSE